MTEQTVRKKIEQGFADCGWSILNGLGSGNWKGGGSWAQALRPLMAYLNKEDDCYREQIKKYQETLEHFLTADTPGKAIEARLYAEQLLGRKL